MNHTKKSDNFTKKLFSPIEKVKKKQIKNLNQLPIRFESVESFHFEITSKSLNIK